MAIASQMKLSLGYDFNQTGQYCSHNYTLYTTTTMSDVGKFMFLLTSHDLDICKVVILGVSNMYLVNQSMKQNL